MGNFLAGDLCRLTLFADLHHAGLSAFTVENLCHRPTPSIGKEAGHAR